MKPTRPKGPSPAVAAYKLLLEYDGTRFHGWQKQSGQGVRTIAGLIENILRAEGYTVKTLHGAGRTDAGVHALGQVAHLHMPTEEASTPATLKRLLDVALPVDVAVRAVESCSPAFHARHDAQSRTYLYQISLRRSAFGKPYVWWVKGKLDLGALKSAWQWFEGRHNIAAFADLEKGEDSRVHITQCDCTLEGALVMLRVQANFFLRRQVRRMVGAAVQCALGKENVQRLERDLTTPSAESTLYWSEKAAPSAGLFLERVDYGERTPPATHGLLWLP